MGVPMQSSLVQVPCKSGSPQGVFGCVQVLDVEGALGACANAGATISAKIEATANSPANRNLIRFSLSASQNAPMLLQSGVGPQLAPSLLLVIYPPSEARSVHFRRRCFRSARSPGSGADPALR